ncbi:MAG TPA: hypothetical protein VFD37_05955, partial [Solirubrobacterales bacterium]|nr:hypothetical protein [Solirubrobacterales bacterium]
MSGGGTRVACLQLQARAPGEPIEARVERVCERVAALGDGGQADLVVLPELWPSGYFAFDRYEEAAE